jgi:hypothetical protein
MGEVVVNGKTYLPLDDLAARTGYDREYLRKLAKANKVDSVRIGATTLINPEDLERYREGRLNRGPHGDKPRQSDEDEPEGEFVYENVGEES